MPLADRFTKEGFQLTILPLPKGQRLAEACGLLDGQAIGHAEGRGMKTPPHWWPQGKVERLPTGAFKDLNLRAAGGQEAAGFWEVGSSGKKGAVMWRRHGGELEVVDLHPDGYTQSYAMGCGGGAQVGVGTPKVKKGEHARDVGLLWCGTKDSVTVLTGEGDVSVLATDGQQHVGNVAASRAALWLGTQLVVLGPEGKATTCNGVGGGEQVGELWVKRGAHAALWKGSAASLVDLNPKGFETSRALACAGGLQVGYAKPQELTKAGFSAPETRACLWAGRADLMIELHAVVPAPWNASMARAIEITGDLVRIVGSVEEFAFHGNAPSIGSRQACIWEARLKG